MLCDSILTTKISIPHLYLVNTFALIMRLTTAARPRKGVRTEGGSIYREVIVDCDCDAMCQRGK